MYQVMLAPAEQWLKQLETAGEILNLEYPVRDSANLYDPKLWKSGYDDQWEPDKDCLAAAKTWHQELDLELSFADPELKKRMFLIVGIGSRKTWTSVSQRESGGWEIGFQAKPGPDKLYNGDGMILFESSYLPLPERDRQIWALDGSRKKELHTRMIGEKDVLAAIRNILNQGTADGCGLVNYTEFVDRIYHQPGAP